jgi:gamma-glutamylcyclotransferase (GGCT)/AIG2-like uncharacterized protein YtfP
MMENLFSYGTLQSKEVQQELFGRSPEAHADCLAGYKKESIKIKLDSNSNSRSVEEHVAIIYSGNDLDIIEGLVLSVSLNELEITDEYETNDYKRIQVTLQSGKASWVYVKNDKA